MRIMNVMDWVRIAFGFALVIATWCEIKWCLYLLATLR